MCDKIRTVSKMEYIKEQGFCFPVGIIQSRLHPHIHNLQHHTSTWIIREKISQTTSLKDINHPTARTHIRTPNRSLTRRQQQQCPTLSFSNTSALPAPASAAPKHSTTTTLLWNPHLPHRTTTPTSAHPSAARAVRARGEASIGSGAWGGRPRLPLCQLLWIDLRESCF